MPPSLVPKPGAAWAPPRTAISIPCVRAWTRAAETSATDSQRAISAG